MRIRFGSTVKRHFRLRQENTMKIICDFCVDDDVCCQSFRGDEGLCLKYEQLALVCGSTELVRALKDATDEKKQLSRQSMVTLRFLSIFSRYRSLL